VRLGLAELPQGVRFSQVWGVSILGGVGFTMALFIAGLAFPDRDMLDAAKLGILAASLLSGVVGYVVLRFTLREAITK
jgi:NhaA family Na+:H+ antiporter